MNRGKSILFSKYFFILAGLIFLGVYFYKKGQGDSDGSSGSVVKNKVMTDVKEIKADGFVPKINMGLLKNNELNINKKKSDDKQELLALRERFRRFEQCEGVNHWGFSLWNVIFFFPPMENFMKKSQEKTRKDGGMHIKKLLPL